METPDFVVIGHVSKDLVGGGYRLGGTAAYAALTARNLGRRVGVVTSAGRDLPLNRLLRGVQVHCLPSPVSTTFVNDYHGEERRQYIYSVAESIPVDAVPPPWRSSPVVHLGPIAHEIDEELMDLFPSSLLGLTPQGWLRQWDEGGLVSPRTWSRASEFLPRVDALMVSEEDMTGEAGTLRSQLHLPRVAVVTEGANGATVHTKGESHHVPAPKARAVDPTGAGDVFAAAFLVRLAETQDPLEACRFANAAASLSVEKAGLASVPLRSEIENLVATIP